MNLAWKVNEAAYTMTLTANFPEGSPPGWAAFGFSSNGMMANGSYVMGYVTGTDLCVLSMVNTDLGSPPVTIGAPSISNASVAVVGQTMTITATLDDPAAFGIAAGTQSVMYAASNSSALPADCESNLTLAMSAHFLVIPSDA